MERDKQTFEIIGAAMEVHRQLGHGFLEAVYQAALAIEFHERGIPFRAEVDLPVFYKSKRLVCGYRADFICFENILIETKAVSAITRRTSRKFSTISRPPSTSGGFFLTSGQRASSTNASSSDRRTICVNLRNLWTI